MKGKLCPRADATQLSFEILSDILGASIYNVTIGFKPNLEQGRPISRFSGFDPNTAFLNGQEDEFVQATMQIGSIERNGTVVINFSDNFDIPNNYEDLTLRQFSAGRIDRNDFERTKHSNLELTIAPKEDQDADSVKFTWDITSFTEIELRLQLSFSQVQRISSGVFENVLQIKVWESKFFVRSSDKT